MTLMKRRRKAREKVTVTVRDLQWLKPLPKGTKAVSYSWDDEPPTPFGNLGRAQAPTAHPPDDINLEN